MNYSFRWKGVIVIVVFTNELFIWLERRSDYQSLLKKTVFHIFPYLVNSLALLYSPIYLWGEQSFGDRYFNSHRGWNLVFTVANLGC